jgi:hypothetical protein
MGQVYQCRWRICREINVLSSLEYHMFYVLYPFVTYYLLYLVIGAEEQYKERMRIEKRMLRKKKRRFHEEQVKQLETSIHRRRFYRLVNDIGKDFRRYIKALRDSSGLTLNEIPAIMNRWKQYFKDLLGDSEMEVSYVRKETEQETN